VLFSSAKSFFSVALFKLFNPISWLA